MHPDQTGPSLGELADEPLRQHRVRREPVWVCTRCDTALDGNPRMCTKCGYTVYRPTWPAEPVSSTPAEPREPLADYIEAVERAAYERGKAEAAAEAEDWKRRFHEQAERGDADAQTLLTLRRELNEARLLLEQAEQYARDLQDGEIVPADLLATVARAEQDQKLAVEVGRQQGIAEGKRQAVAIIDAESYTDGELYRWLILGEDGSAPDA